MTKEDLVDFEIEVFTPEQVLSAYREKGPAIIVEKMSLYGA